MSTGRRSASAMATLCLLLIAIAHQSHSVEITRRQIGSTSGTQGSLSAVSSNSASAVPPRSSSLSSASESAVAGGTSSDSDEESDEDTSAESGEGAFSTHVYANSPDGENSLNRVWDDEQGGSTIMLSNRNSLEAWERQPRNKKQDNFLGEVKREQQKEALLLKQARDALKQKKDIFERKLENLKSTATQQLVKAAKQIENKSAKLSTVVFKLTKGKHIADNKQIVASNARTVMFWLKPHKISNDWTNILQKGDKGGDRAPAIFFYPKCLRLHVRSATVGAWNAGADPDPAQPLELDVWTHVAVTHKAGELKVFLNGAVVSTTTNIGAPSHNLAAVYACGQDYDCPDAHMGDLRFYSRALSEKEVLEATQEPFDQKIPSSRKPFGSSEALSTSSQDASSSASVGGSSQVLTPATPAAAQLPPNAPPVVGSAQPAGPAPLPLSSASAVPASSQPSPALSAP